MTIPEMLSQSGILTLLGLGVVFSFLVILVGVMKLVEILVRVTGLDKENETQAHSGAAANGRRQRKDSDCSDRGST